MTEAHYTDDAVTLHHGDCLDVLRGMPDSSVDAIVTDPPAGISFMSKSWDHDLGGRTKWVAWMTEVMTEALRVIRPGGHALVWALPRTSHWTSWAIESAGFDVRDCIVHIFGTGFPKSLDVSKAIDKCGAVDIIAFKADLANMVSQSGFTRTEVDLRCGFTMRFDVSYVHDPVGWGVSMPSPDKWSKIKDVLGCDDRWDALIHAQWRGRSGAAVSNNGSMAGDNLIRTTKGAPVTLDAATWAGWGTALKPASEHWWLARKPLAGTVAGNVLRYGTGALNIDACRVETSDRWSATGVRSATSDVLTGGVDGSLNVSVSSTHAAGRWPANVVLSHTEWCGGDCPEGCPVRELDAQSGSTTSSGGAGDKSGRLAANVYGDYSGAVKGAHAGGLGDAGGASRFFPTFRYEAKAPTFERPGYVDDDGVSQAHSTVKPVDLMRWLVRLVTPPSGTVLDPFAGSGTTGEACIVEGFKCVLIEREAAYLPLIVARLSKPIQPDLFGGAA